MTRHALACIACGRELENVEETATNQPYEGTAFASYGHYGSTAWDPMDGRFLEINICDPCLRQHQDRVLEGKDWELIIEGGLVTGSKKMDQPLALVPWKGRS